jgi:hypothetical protein
MAKWIIGIIIIGLLGGALWFSGILGNMNKAPVQAPVTTAATTTAPAAPAVPQPENGMAATSDASDQALTQDAAAVDAQMTGLNSDNASVDSSLNDQQTAQSY